MSVRAKFEVVTVAHHRAPPGAALAVITLAAVSQGAENANWSKWTPNGKLEMTVTNPEAVARFEVGKAYLLDFTPAD